MGEAEQIDDGENLVAQHHLDRWAGLIAETANYRLKNIHPKLTGHLALVIDRILFRLAASTGKTSLAFEELQRISRGTSKRQIYRAIDLIAELNICRVEQQRRGGQFHFQWSESWFDELEHKVRCGLKVVPIRRR